MKHSYGFALGRKTRHSILVTIYATRSVMRRALRKLGHDSSNTEAACWTNGRFDGNFVAEIHLAYDRLKLRSIVHEAVHAARHRQKLLGVIDEEWSEETLAEDTATIVQETVRFWRRVKTQKVKYARRKSDGTA